MRVDGLRGKSFLAWAQWARAKSGPGTIAILLDYPILCYGILSQFHATSKNSQRLKAKGEPVNSPCGFANSICIKFNTLPGIAQQYRYCGNLCTRWRQKTWRSFAAVCLKKSRDRAARSLVVN
jgi:hypothetical protein